MRYIDYACAWGMFLTAAIFLVVIEVWRPPGAGFDTALFWMPVAMINFLRLRNGYRSIDGLRTFSIIANLMVLTLEIIRLGEWGGWVFRGWGWYYVLMGFWSWSPYFVISVTASGELLFSIFHKDASTDAVSV
jgi:hypothetical protein